MNYFSAKIFKTDINPCVKVPAAVLKSLLSQSGKLKGPVAVKGRLNGAAFIQTVVRFRGEWLLYINGRMLADAGIRNGDMARVEIEYDPVPRRFPVHPKLKSALKHNKKAKDVFDNLPPYRRKEIVRYLHHLKTDEAVEKNIEKVIRHLTENEKFAGRKLKQFITLKKAVPQV